MAAKAMKAGMHILRPLLVETGAPQIGTLVIGTVKGDIHDIGKNLVKYMLQGSGFNVVDLGNDVSPEQFAEGVRANAKERGDEQESGQKQRECMVGVRNKDTCRDENAQQGQAETIEQA